MQTTELSVRVIALFIVYLSLILFPTDVGSGLGDQSFVQGLGTLYHTINATGPGDLVTYIGNFLSVQVCLFGVLFYATH